MAQQPRRPIRRKRFVDVSERKPLPPKPPNQKKRVVINGTTPVVVDASRSSPAVPKPANGKRHVRSPKHPRRGRPNGKSGVPRKPRPKPREKPDISAQKPPAETPVPNGAPLQRVHRDTRSYSIQSLVTIVKGQDQAKGDLLANRQQNLYELKRSIYLLSKKNFTLERDIRLLDKKIALLIRNRISIEEITNNGDFSLINQSGTMKSKKQRQLYGELFWILQNETTYIAQLARLVNLGEIDNLLQTVMFTLYGNQFDDQEEHLLLSMFKLVLECEFEKAKGIGGLLRANSALTRMMTTYTRRGAGQCYLKETLTDVLSDLCKQSTLVLEINPLKVYLNFINDYEIKSGQKSTLNRSVTAEEAAKNPDVQKIIAPRIQKLDELASKFIEALIGSLKNIPYGIKWICKQIKDLVRIKFPDASREQMCSLIGGFYLLRFINPAIVTPQAFMLVDKKLSSTTRRNLTLLAKILQNLANNVRFGGVKEFYMQPLNVCLDKNKERLNKFLMELTRVEDLEDHLRLDKYLALEKTETANINISFNEMYFIHNLLVKHKATMLTSSKHKAIKDTLQALGAPPELLPRKENANIDLVLMARSDDESSTVTPEQLYHETKNILFTIIKTLPEEKALQLKNLDEIIKAARNWSKLTGDKDIASKCKKLGKNCDKLVKLGFLKADDNYAQLRKDAVAELHNYEEQLKKTKQLEGRLQKVLGNVEDHQKFLIEQYDAYKSYLTDVRSKCGVSGQQGKNAKGSKVKKKTRKEKKAARQRRVGPFKYAYNQLVREGIIKQSLVPKDRRSHITFSFSSTESGVYLVEVSWRGKKIQSLQLLLVELLERQQDNCVDFETDFLTLDVNLLLHLLNKHFVFPTTT